MSNAYRISCPQPKLSGHITLEPSKSISNRALIIQSLCNDEFSIHNLSKSDDTVVLQKMLTTESDVLFSGHAGSSFRFMLAKACLGEKEVTLDASEQLRRRPIGPLVKALQSLGADITYLNKEGFPPLLIKPDGKLGNELNEIHLQSGVSSQYVSALAMIAPVLPNGLILHLSDDPVSVPYIRMTLELMRWFGIDHTWEENTITIQSGVYKGRDFTVEGDWSAASYYYSMAALVPEADIRIDGLTKDSLQGDSAVRDIYMPFGVKTVFTKEGIQILKEAPAEKIKEIRLDFSNTPDLAQTVMVTLSGLGIKGLLSGLKTLRLKETDRVAAMRTELLKVKTVLEIHKVKGDITVIQTGKAKWKDKAKFDTYDDHRMAMSLAALACINPIIMRDTEVVSKSYPGFWKDASKIGLKSVRLKGKA